MEMPINAADPIFMHVDLNSCFAMAEQQANPLIRNKPVAIASYDSPGGTIIASSYEAKALGIKLGINVAGARNVCPEVIIMMPDPEKYFDIHRRFQRILLKYTDEVYPRSVDEFLVDFKGSSALRNGITLEEIGADIKLEIRKIIGEYVTVNVGIGLNPFLAKLAASLNKPNGLDLIDSNNLLLIYSKLSLMDLPGINYRYQARLNLAGIYTPLDFFNAKIDVLKNVFKSINAYYWYLRLRGYKIDTVDFTRKSFGAQYALANKTLDINELSRLLMKLSEKIGRRLRNNGYKAYGIKLCLGLGHGESIAKSKKLSYSLYSTIDIYKAAYRLLVLIIKPKAVRQINISVYCIELIDPKQNNLFQETSFDSINLANAMDKINSQYGEYTVTSALMNNMQNTILKRVAFGKII